MIPDLSTLPDGNRFTITRRFRAPLADLWALWTTAQGIERWWGPPGFAVIVQSIDLRVSGTLAYTMTAHQPEMVGFMQAMASQSPRPPKSPVPKWRRFTALPAPIWSISCPASPPVTPPSRSSFTPTGTKARCGLRRVLML